MSFTEKISKNSKQLQILNNKTEHHINALIKEERTVIRCLQHDEICFHNKYLKFYSRKGTSDFRKRNTAPVKKTPPEHDIKTECWGIHSLIFSGDEIDIHKVLCLHLLTMYEISNTQEISSLQNLLKHNNNKKQVNKILPNYIAKFYYKSKYEMLPESPTKKVCFIVNCYLESLLDVILDVLQEVNPKKFAHIIQISKNITVLDELMQKQNIVSMVEELKENPLVTDIINFRTEMGNITNLNSDGKSNGCLTAMRVKIKDSHYKFNLIKQEIKKSLRKRTEKGVDCTLGSTLSLLQKKLWAGRAMNHNGSIMSLTSKSIDLSNLSMLTPEEITFFANIESILQSNSKLFFQIESKLNSANNRNSLYDNCLIYRSALRPYLSKTKRGTSIPESECKRIMQSLLQKLNHGQRILVGKRAAQLKSAEIIQGGLGTQNTPIASVIADVLSADSLISLACSSCNEELELIMTPCSRGGLGIGEQLAESEQESKFSIDTSRQHKGLIDLKMSATDMKAVKQALRRLELKFKVNSLVQAENP